MEFSRICLCLIFLSNVCFGQTPPIPFGTGNASASTLSVIGYVSKIGTSSGVTTGTLNATGANLIIVGGAQYTAGSTTPFTIADNMGNSYTNVRYDYHGTSPNFLGTALYYYYGTNVSSAMTWSTTGWCSLFVIACSGSTSTPLLNQLGATGGPTNFMQPGSISAITGSVAVNVVQSYTATAAPSTPTSYTSAGSLPYSTNYSASMFFYVIPSTSSQNPISNFSSTVGFAESTIANFK